MSQLAKAISASIVLAMTGCATLPDGPSVLVLPGTGISFEQFRNDDAVCQQYALFQVGGTTPSQASVNSSITSAAVGTALGAAAGAAIGGTGSGAAIGAGTGLVGGSIVCTGSASSSLYETQERFDFAYIQCMYAKGHQVPVSGQFSGATMQQPAASSTNIPPPPPGSPPPPPSASKPLFPK